MGRKKIISEDERRRIAKFFAWEYNRSAYVTRGDLVKKIAELYDVSAHTIMRCISGRA